MRLYSEKRVLKDTLGVSIVSNPLSQPIRSILYGRTAAVGTGRDMALMKVRIANTPLRKSKIRSKGAQNGATPTNLNARKRETTTSLNAEIRGSLLL